RERGRSEPGRILAAVDGTAVLAVRAAVVPMAAVRPEHRRCGALSDRAWRPRPARTEGGGGPRPAGAGVFPPCGALRQLATAARAQVFALVMVSIRPLCLPIESSASLWRLFFRRHRGRSPQPRQRPVGGRWHARAVLAGLARGCGSDIPALDRPYRPDHGVHA